MGKKSPEERGPDLAIHFVDLSPSGDVLDSGTIEVTGPLSPEEIEVSLQRGRVGTAMRDTAASSARRGPARFNSDAFCDNYDGIFGRRETDRTLN